MNWNGEFGWLCQSAGTRRLPPVCMYSPLSDWKGAKAAGFQARLLRRPGPDGEQAHKEEDEVLDGVDVIQSLEEVLAVATA